MIGIEIAFVVFISVGALVGCVVGICCACHPDGHHRVIYQNIDDDCV
jgi:hypothetical protein